MGKSKIKSKNNPSKNNTLRYALISSITIVIYLISLSISNSYAEDIVSISERNIFKDSNDKLNLVGTLTNIGKTPLEVSIGVDVKKPFQSEQEVLKSKTFASVLYPHREVPFKFTIKNGELFEGSVFVVETKEVNKPLFATLKHEYSNIAMGDEKALIGTIKNIGSSIINDVAIYASVHSKDGTQLDSVKSTVIPILYPGEEKPYKIIPEPTTRSLAYYYSCAGLDINSPITTLDLGGEFLAFNFESASLVSNFIYDKSSDSIMFTIKPYNPEGGDLIFKIPQSNPNQKVNISVDGKAHKEATISTDGKTITMKVSIPSDEHKVIITGARNGV
ncbi:MAG TPA: hypothetical protein VJ767_06765 [Nitrososphaeraceae archaeon]|nr:hypothetical protein [Nitrososphaeraceae archaeon]